MTQSFRKAGQLKTLWETPETFAYRDTSLTVKSMLTASVTGALDVYKNDPIAMQKAMYNAINTFRPYVEMMTDIIQEHRPEYLTAWQKVLVLI